MNHPLSLTLGRVGPHRLTRPGGIQAWSTVMRVAELLPAALTDFVYLEQWLRGDRLDLIVRLDQDGRDLLIGGRLAPGCALRTAFRSSPAWRRVEAMARAWQTNPRLRNAISALWLEFDLEDTRPEEARALPGPRVFVDFTSAAAAEPSLADRHALAVAALAPLLDDGSVLDGSVASGFSRKTLTGTANQLQRLLACLPRGAHVIYAGAGHDGRTVRACIAGLQDRIVDYLEEVRWPGNVDALAARLAPLDAPPVALLHLDFTDTLLPRAGLEYVLDRRSQRRGYVREQAFLDRLVERDLCDRDHRDALGVWPGQSTELLPHAVWYSRLVRRVNHVKVVYDERQGIAAKGYLCFFHRLTGRTPPLFDRRGTRMPAVLTTRAAGATAGADAT